VKLAHGCLTNVPSRSYIGFVRISDTHMVDTESLDNQIRVLAMFQQSLEETKVIPPNLPWLSVIDSSSSLQYTAGQRLCARLLSLVLAKPGRIIAFASPDRLTRRFSELVEFLHHCALHNVPVFCALPFRHGTAGVQEALLHELNPRNMHLMNELQQYMDAEFVVVQSLRDRNEANYARLRGNAQDLQQMLHARGILDPSQVVGIARVSGTPSTRQAHVLDRQQQLIQSLLPFGSVCYAYHQSISTATEVWELEWTARLVGKRVLVCKRLDRLVRNLQALQNLVLRFPKLWIVITHPTQQAPAPTNGEAFLAFRLEDLMLVNEEPSPLQTWAHEEMVSSVKFCKSMSHGSRPLLQTMYSAGKSKFPAVTDSVSLQAAGRFYTNEEMFRRVSTVKVECTAAPRTLMACLGPHFLETPVRWQTTHLRTDEDKIVEIVGRSWVVSGCLTPQPEVATEPLARYVRPNTDAHPADIEEQWEADLEAELEAEMEAQMEDGAEEHGEDGAAGLPEEERDHANLARSERNRKAEATSAKRDMMHVLDCMGCGQTATEEQRPVCHYGATCGKSCALAIAERIGCEYPKCSSCENRLPFIRSSKGIQLCKTCLGQQNPGRSREGWDRSVHRERLEHDEEILSQMMAAVGQENEEAVIGSNFATRLFCDVARFEPATLYVAFFRKALLSCSDHVDMDKELDHLCITMPNLLSKKIRGSDVLYVAHFPGRRVNPDATLITMTADDAVNQYYQRRREKKRRAQMESANVKKERRKAATIDSLKQYFPKFENWDLFANEQNKWLEMIFWQVYSMNVMQGYLTPDHTRLPLAQYLKHRKIADVNERRPQLINEAAQRVPQYFYKLKHREGKTNSGSERLSLGFNLTDVAEKNERNAENMDDGAGGSSEP
jgi:hypothetical protein